MSSPEQSAGTQDYVSGHPRGGLFKALKACLKNCKEASSSSLLRKRRLLMCMGASSVGKSTMLDSLFFMVPDSPYPGKLQATSGNLKAILDQLFGIKIRDVDRDIEDVPSLDYDLWLDNDGCLNPEIAEEYQERHAKSSAHMSRAFLKGAALRASNALLLSFRCSMSNLQRLSPPARPLSCSATLGTAWSTVS
ncbi:hypothetical protein WJX84_010446 [Apatococcus fuscideae]|uniref:Uncharacterized protein n=1 Tax=Apatococcus fuscideae TaxID=2026836 RepID=A0AAW1T3K5_9CHLO